MRTSYYRVKIEKKQEKKIETKFAYQRGISDVVKVERKLHVKKG